MIEAPVAPARLIETVTPIKPSEAIRLGSIGNIQAFGMSWEMGGVDRDKVLAACALGAMSLGYGLHPDTYYDIDTGEGMDHPAFAIFSYLDDRVVACPASQEPCPHVAEPTYREQIVHLNDEHGWSRERIADWLESVGM